MYKRDFKTGSFDRLAPVIHSAVSLNEKVNTLQRVGLFYSLMQFYVTSEDDRETFLDPTDYGLTLPE